MRGQIITIAGTGEKGFQGDERPASQSPLHGPTGIASDVRGLLYIADTENGRIRKIRPDGILVTVAGAGPGISLVTRGQATRTRLAAPTGVALDGAGNLYVSDTRSHRIRKVAIDGGIATIAGTGAAAFAKAVVVSGDPAVKSPLLFPAGLAVDGRYHLFITEGHRVRRLAPDGALFVVAGTGDFGYDGDGCLAFQASFRDPKAVAVDSAGNLYIADSGNHRVRKVTTDGKVTTVAGTGGQETVESLSQTTSLPLRTVLVFPSALAIDCQDNLFIAESNRVRKLSAGGIMSTVAGRAQPGFAGDGGPASEALLRGPKGLAIDPHGNLFIADTGNHRIRMIAEAADAGRLPHHGARR